MGSQQAREVRDYEKVDCPAVEWMQKLISGLVVAMLAPMLYFIHAAENIRPKQCGQLVLYELTGLAIMGLLIVGLREAAKVPPRVQKIHLEGSVETVVSAEAALGLARLGFVPKRGQIGASK